MQVKDLQLKRALRSVLLVLLLSAVGMGKMDAQNLNLIVNGDFEQTTGFDYQAISDYTRIWSGGVQEGKFIRDNTSTGHGVGALGWPANLTGYGGSGCYLLFNGFGGSQNPTKRVWWQQVNVTTQTTYTFKCYVRNLSQSSWLFTANPSILQVKINGSPAGSTVTLDINSYNWVEITRTWNSGNISGPINIEIFDVYTGNPDSGDDFGLDHISFIPNVLYDVNAQDDYVSNVLCLNDYVDVDVLQNDNVLPNTNDAQVQVLTNPVPHGTAQVLSNKKIRYTFTDADYNGEVQFSYHVTNHGVTDEAWVFITTSTSPSVGNITAPEAINAGGSFNLTQPTIQPNGSTIFNQGWQIAATQSGNYTPFNNNNVPYSYNGYWIRYFAENGCGVGYSNAVQITVYQNDNNITFADANVKAICVANWDTDGDGELSYAEAAAVTDLGEVFRENTGITSFEELQYFTGLTTISSYAFYSCSNLSGSLYIPNSVTEIGASAFRNCSGLIGNLTIPNSVTSIGISAFSDCSGFTGGLTIPNSVIAIGDAAFFGCGGLTSVIIGDSVTLISQMAFGNCSGLTSVIIGSSVTQIGNGAFYFCSGLTSLTIPNSVTSIESWAFGFCYGLISIFIPNSVTSIEAGLFYCCSSLGQIVVETGNAFYDSRENCNAIINTSTNELVAGCKNTIIPNSVTSIGNSAFDGCSGLTSLNIPNSVISIGNYAFQYCYGLTSLDIPNSITSIGMYAFQNCNSLTSIDIPNSVTSIGDFAFRGCSGFEQIIVGFGNTVYDSRENCNAIIKTSSNELLVGCKNTLIPNSVTSIGQFAFLRTGLTSIIIPNSVTSIGDWAFQECSGLSTMTVLAETPPTLGSDVFNK